MDWLKGLSACRSSNTSSVIVMITKVSGSAPRTVGTRMLVTARKIFGTIGGGALELEGISHARALIDTSMTSAQAHSLVTRSEFALGKELSQCCGGVVELQFDCHFAIDYVLNVFGAGHVGQEVTRLALRLPCVTVIHDTRKEWLACVDNIIAREENQIGIVTTRLMDINAYQYIETLNTAAYYLVMTHSHELDMDIVEAVLSCADAAYCGLIASDSKAARFRNRLKRKGFADAEIKRLTAPLGRNVSTGNTPMEVAVAGVSDVLSCRKCLQDYSNSVPAGISTVPAD